MILKKLTNEFFIFQIVNTLKHNDVYLFLLTMAAVIFDK